MGEFSVERAFNSNNPSTSVNEALTNNEKSFKDTLVDSDFLISGDVKFNVAISIGFVPNFDKGEWGKSLCSPIDTLSIMPNEFMVKAIDLE